MDTIIEDIMYIILKQINNVKQLNLVNKKLNLIVTKYMYKNFYFTKTNIDNKNLIENVICGQSQINKRELKNHTNIKKIIFADDFNQKIKDFIPSSVTDITLGVSFQQNLKDAIPYNVKRLTINSELRDNIRKDIPESITDLIIKISHLILMSKNYYHHSQIKCTYIRRNKYVIPASVTHLTIFQPVISCEISVNITHLTMYCDKVDCELPSSITHLSIVKIDKDYQLDLLPNGKINVFVLDSYLDIRTTIPNSVTHLTLGGLTNVIIPPSVTHLVYLGRNKKIYIKNIPKTVKFFNKKKLIF